MTIDPKKYLLFNYFDIENDKDDIIYYKYIIYKLYYIHNLFNFIKKYKEMKNIDFLFQKLISFDIFKNNIENSNNFLIFNGFQFCENYINFKNHIEKYHNNFTVNYAVKSLCDDNLINKLIDINANFDCASIGEINVVLRNNGNINSIIYANPFKTIKSITVAESLNVRYTTFDSYDELIKLYKYGKNIKLILRINVDSYGKINLSNKFGIYYDDMMDLLNTNHIHLKNIIGLSFHVGSDTDKPLGWLLALKKVFEYIEILKKYDINIQIIDLGGGYNIYNYKTIIDCIFDIYGKDLKKYKLIFEPGRLISNNSVVYIPNLLYKNRSMYIDNEILFSYFKDSILVDRIFYYINILNNKEYTLRDINNEKINSKLIKIDDKINYDDNEECLFIFENFGSYTISISNDNYNVYKIYI